MVHLPLGVLVTVSIVLRPLEQNDTPAEAADETAESALRKIGFPVKPSPRAVSAQKNRVLGTSVMFS